jgi:choline dehydrogenase-like flavoprotein
VCVVGAGPAGAIVAARLAEAGHDVVVLEAGPRFDEESRREKLDSHLRPGEENPWGMGGQRDAYTNEGDRDYPLNAARVKGVGGSTLHWQGMVMRLHERDFEMQTRHGVGTDWPIDYDELRPYYAAAERELSVAGADDNPYAPPREDRRSRRRGQTLCSRRPVSRWGSTCTVSRTRATPRGPTRHPPVSATAPASPSVPPARSTLPSGTSGPPRRRARG